MLHTRISCVFSLVRQVRFSSGYKISPDNYSRDRLRENFTEEDEFREKVELAILKRAKTKLHGFDKINDVDIVKKTEGPDPNELYRNHTDLPSYRSFRRYFDSAERVRRRQREEGVWWKTLDFWTKEREKEPIFRNVGSSFLKQTKGAKASRKAELKELRNDEKLEKNARERTLILDPEIVMKEWETSPVGVHHVRDIAHHYNIFQDLFGDVHFLPALHMEIGYECGDDSINPVYYGNEILPSEAEAQPVVTFEAKPDKHYTLLATNPDEHLEDNNREYIHWLVGNIPGDDISQGEILVDYLRPFPARGTGYHRMVFVLFEQTKTINFESEKRPSPCTLLYERDFKTSEFFGKFQDQLTPVSLRFFQCRWEQSVQKTYHDILKMQEPVYEYAKLSEKPRLRTLTRYTSMKTLQWLSNFMPKEPVYPDGSLESIQVRRQAALESSAAPQREDRVPYPVKRVY